MHDTILMKIGEAAKNLGEHILNLNYKEDRSWGEKDYSSHAAKRDAGRQTWGGILLD